MPTPILSITIRFCVRDQYRATPMTRIDCTTLVPNKRFPGQM